jgi:hypothetical protein
MLFFSSSEIYGDPFPEFIPTNEEYRGNVLPWVQGPVMMRPKGSAKLYAMFSVKI